MSRQYLQIGNAVPVALGRAIGTSICNAAQRQYEASETQESIEMMLAKAQRRLRASARNKRALSSIKESGRNNFPIWVGKQ